MGKHRREAPDPGAGKETDQGYEVRGIISDRIRRQSPEDQNRRESSR